MVLSGGGVLGYSYIGMLRYLEERHLIQQFTTFCGSSAGALFSFLVSIGYTAAEIGAIFATREPTTFMNITLDSCMNLHRVKGLDSGATLKIHLNTILTNKGGTETLTLKEHYAKYNKILRIGVTDIIDHKFVLMDYLTHPDVSVIEAVRASMAIPFLLEPVCINGRYYVDGGISNNFPIELCDADTCIGINLINHQSYMDNSPIFDITKINLGDYLDILIKSAINHYITLPAQYQNCTVPIEIPTSLATSFKFTISIEEITQCISYGYESMLRKHDTIWQKTISNIITD